VSPCSLYACSGRLVRLPHPDLARPVPAIVLAVALAASGGCATRPARDRAAAERPPDLLSAGVLDVPAGCPAVPGAVYRAEFVVGESGAVEQVTRADGPPCVQSALSQWLRTFHYAAGSAQASATIDWMVTVARR